MSEDTPEYKDKISPYQTIAKLDGRVVGICQYKTMLIVAMQDGRLFEINHHPSIKTAQGEVVAKDEYIVKQIESKLLIPEKDLYKQMQVSIDDTK